MPTDCPPGWKKNPSAWPERIPVVLLSLVGFAVAAFLAAFQSCPATVTGLVSAIVVGAAAPFAGPPVTGYGGGWRAAVRPPVRST